MISQFFCRAARNSDVDELVILISKLAAHHGDEATVTSDDLRLHGFERPRFHAIVAEAGERVIGYALWYVIIRNLMWADHEVTDAGEGVYLYKTRRHGEVTFQHSTLIPEILPNLRIVIYVRADRV